ncbi:hypothetical protein [Streptomyces osmaniensis]|uniref:Uncharacterized protein n=1 Tax=Streptomyces osmaniensis TaxID=593134 RepID=A0ABP6YZH1_9ACTN|nr:hypothetical protein KJK32_46775 [Streptomyces sp. JCM17656]
MQNLHLVQAASQKTNAEDDAAIQALSEQGAQCGACGDEPGDRRCPDCERCRGWYVAALRAIGWAPRAELQTQLDQAKSELAAIKKQMADLHEALTGEPA